MTLEELWDIIKEKGPTRTMINEHGTVVTPFRAQTEHRITTINIIFIREDGWSIAAPMELETIAHGLYEDKWIGFSLHPFNNVQLIQHYKPGVSGPQQEPEEIAGAWRGESEDVAEERAQRRGR